MKWKKGPVVRTISKISAFVKKCKDYLCNDHPSKDCLCNYFRSFEFCSIVISFELLKRFLCNCRFYSVDFVTTKTIRCKDRTSIEVYLELRQLVQIP